MSEVAPCLIGQVVWAEREVSAGRGELAEAALVVVGPSEAAAAYQEPCEFGLRVGRSVRKNLVVELRRLHYILRLWVENDKRPCILNKSRVRIEALHYEDLYNLRSY